MVGLSIHNEIEDEWNITTLLPISAVEGTPLATTTNTSAINRPDSPFEPFVLSIFYVANNGTLQEFTLSQDGQIYTHGSLGRAGLNVSTSPMSPLAAGFVGVPDAIAPVCNDAYPSKWLMYRPQNESFVQELLYNQAADEWYPAHQFHGLDPYSGFAIVLTHTPAEALSTATHPWFKKWFIGVNTDRSLEIWSCKNCCGNSTDDWKNGKSSSFRHLSSISSD